MSERLKGQDYLTSDCKGSGRLRLLSISGVCYNNQADTYMVKNYRKNFSSIINEGLKGKVSM